jgi:hypothetical protein
MQAQVLTAVAPLLYMKEAVKSMKWRLKQLPHQQQVASFQAKSRTGISKWIELVNEVSKIQWLARLARLESPRQLMVIRKSLTTGSPREQAMHNSRPFLAEPSQLLEIWTRSDRY